MNSLKLLETVSGTALALAIAFAAPASAQVSSSEVPGRSTSGADPATNQGNVQSGGDATSGAVADTDATTTVGDIIVTAQRRAEALSRVGVTVTAIGAEELVQRSIDSPADLVKVVPGFQVTTSYGGSPNYTLRGVGFNTRNVSATAPVGLYVDEAAVPYPYMSLGLLFDLERVEALKGPQGTLYGRNATGGLINFVTAKPTDTPQGGFSLEFGNYRTLNASGFASGPLAEGLRARLAFDVQNRFQGWQRSITRGERLGKIHQQALRLTLEADSGGPFSLSLIGTYWNRQGDTIAPQSILYLPDRLAVSPFGFADARASTRTNWSENTQADFLSPTRQSQADIGIYHPAPLTDSQFASVTARGSYELADSIRLVSLTSYNHLRQRDVSDAAGLQVASIYQDSRNRVRSISEELRLLGESDRFNWSIGGYYAKDDAAARDFGYADENATIARLRAISLSLPQTRYTPQQIRRGFGNYRVRADIDTEVLAGFANADYKISDLLKVTIGGRYTRDKISYTGCTYDTDGRNAVVVNLVYPLLIGRTVDLQANRCYILNSTSTAFVDLIRSNQTQKNFAWRANLDVTPSDRVLFYGSVSRGYKAGGFPVLAGSNEVQYVPVRQEKLTAYELGTKLGLFDRTVQLNLSAFYYDYTDKQIFGRVADLVFSTLSRISNVPKSREYGVEMDATWRATPTLTFKVAGVYLDTKIKEYTGFTEFGAPANFAGRPFAYTPKFQGNASINYDVPVTDELRFNAQVDGSYQTKSQADFSGLPEFRIKAYGLVNGSLGIASDEGWRIGLYGKNLGDHYYWTGVSSATDTVFRYPGMTREYGVRTSFKF